MPSSTSYLHWRHLQLSANLLTLNSSKTEFLIIGLKQQLSKIDNSSLNTTHSARNLGLYRAMHFSAKRGIAIACRLSVRLSVRPSVTLVDCDHIGWNSSKIISPLVSLGRSLFVTPTRRVCSKGNTPKFSPE